MEIWKHGQVKNEIIFFVDIFAEFVSAGYVSELRYQGWIPVTLIYKNEIYNAPNKMPNALILFFVDIARVN
jgi:hypothetical protein